MATPTSRVGSKVVLLLTVALAVAAAAAAGVTQVQKWRTEVYPDEVVVTVRSDTANEYLSLFCRTGSKRMGTKLSGTAYEVRFDAEPAEKFWPLEKDLARLIAKLASHDRMLLRMDTGYRQVGEAQFALAGAAQALEPLVEGCALPAELLTGTRPGGAAAPTAPASKAAPAERKRTVGTWEVLETTSRFDDRPVVMVSGGGLYARCREGKLEVYIDEISCSRPMFGEGPVVVTAVFEGGPSTRHETNCSMDGKARFLMEAAGFLKEAVAHPRVTLQYRDLGKDKSRVMALQDLPQALGPLRAACPFD